MNLSDPTNLFFTADTHFGHGNSIKYCDRPYRSTEEMDRKLIASWNETVPEKGIVFHLGDFSFLPVRETEKILDSLHGTICFVQGNHDYGWTNRLKSRMAEVSDLRELRVRRPYGRARIVMCHYPMEEWNRKGAGAWHLHGHSHGNAARRTNRLDVGVDHAHQVLGALRPFTFFEVEAYMAANSPKESDSEVA